VDPIETNRPRPHNDTARSDLVLGPKTSAVRALRTIFAALAFSGAMGLVFGGVVVDAGARGPGSWMSLGGFVLVSLSGLGRYVTGRSRKRRSARLGPRAVPLPEQVAVRRRAMRGTVGAGVMTVAVLVGGILRLTTTSSDTLDGVIFVCLAPPCAFLVYLGARLLRRGARTGDYSPPLRGLP
jgi:hypothetical protein